MSKIEKVEMPTPAKQPGLVGQATAVEQARAVAEVQAAIVVAQQVPRDLSAAIAAMRESCQQMALAERAFFRFPRGGKVVTGPSVHLARELARCWGNFQYGVHEMRRDDGSGQSEMQAWAWDVQTNTRSSHTFIVPHKRDKQSGPERLVDMRDIYENNANNGARRLREAIFAVLPPWFTEEAKELCAKTVRDGGGKPLATRVTDAVKAFESVGVSVDDLERKVGRPTAKWNEHDVAQLAVTFKALERGEVSRDEEFPPQRVTAAEIAEQKAPATPPDVPSESPADDRPDGEGRVASEAQLRRLSALLRSARGVVGEDRFPVVSEMVGREIASMKDLSVAEASSLIEDLEARPDAPEGGEAG